MLYIFYLLYYRLQIIISLHLCATKILFRWIMCRNKLFPGHYVPQIQHLLGLFHFIPGIRAGNVQLSRAFGLVMSTFNFAGA